jgi:hypothetical protein
MKCCNPMCESLFDHREGRLVRFSGVATNRQTPKRQPVVRHYWLCGKCAAHFVFETGSGGIGELKPREPERSQDNHCLVTIAAA